MFDEYDDDTLISFMLYGCRVDRMVARTLLEFPESDRQAVDRDINL